MKTNKSYTKRLKVTKNGKILGRKPGFNHYNAKQSRTFQLAGRKMTTFVIKNKARSHLMPGM
ncbi:MAG: 50S ribosomal protein L35 [Candidatus Nomurabacteria bacterium GW2011_GWB1_37_5]|uniref:50S ribosomal protein L35 n=1 Tax=Candidatus Nomurabacteria bacterium GW2011_GWB1_37_5 TaxID=1618742 RepID=A0A0G0JC54_9BACT|nr:MAG: 50S ribosomal protein L35 [Candidatus Nomurabacteria bacterium GW2011_GWB1_37_5]